MWKDEQLTWEPNEYNDTQSLDIGNHFHQIWKPDFILINNAFIKNKPLLDSGGVTTVMHNGTVIFWTNYISIQATCPVTVKIRPWYNHTCQLDFKTSSLNPLFTIHHQSESSLPRILNNSDRSNSGIESPWTVSKTERVTSIDGNHTSSDYAISIDVELNRNIGIFKSTRCVPFSNTYKDEIKCHLFSKFNLLLPSPSGFVQTPYSPLITAIISYVDLNIEDGTLLLIGYKIIKWEDERMVWDTKKFGNMWHLDIDDADSVWKPNLVLNNNLIQEDSINKRSFGTDDLRVLDNGDCHWKYSIKILTKCDMSSNGWPWDPQKCQLDFTLSTPAVDFLSFKYHLGYLHGVPSLWTITSFQQVQDLLKLKVEITLKMNSNTGQVVLLSTFIAVSLVMLISFLIPPMSGMKLTSKISSTLLLILFLLMMISSIPNFSTKAYNFVIGLVVLLLILGVSSCVTAKLVQFSRIKHSSLVEQGAISEESKCENSKVDTLQLQPMTSTDDECTSEESLLNRNGNKWLNVAVVVELSSFGICLIVVIFLIMSL
ncbi:acetylcholine receptor subunit alpha-like 2 isoform X2 [Planococcus citri]